MTSLKCPHCGREVETRHATILSEMNAPDAEHKPGEAHCPHCGWTGALSDLIAVGL